MGIAFASTLGVLALWPARAEASGIAAARFGGEHGHPTTDNPTALYYNPAGIALSKGTHVFIDGTIALRFASYDRPATESSSPVTNDIAPGANDGKATLFNAIAAPFVGITSDFGTNFIYGGISVSVPFGGSAVWDKNKAYQGNAMFPGAADGQARWYSIDGSIRSLYVTGGLAFNIRKIGLSLGVTGSLIRSNVETIRARNADGSDDLVTVAGDTTTLKEGRSYINVAGLQGGFGIGAIYDVLKLGKYFIGLSYTSQPNVVGGMKLKGTLDNALSVAPPDQTPVELTQTLPDIVRIGFRARPTDKYELRVFADWTRWSVFKKQCVLDRRVEDRNCDFANEGSALDDPESYGGDADPSVVQHLPRFWKDAGGVRVGGSYWFVPEVEGYLGAGYDSSAVPVQTLDPALMDMHKMSISAGVRWQIVRQFALAFTATELIFFRTSTKGKSALNRFASPTKQPSGNGVYKQFFQLFNIYVDISFGYKDGKWAQRRAAKKKKATPDSEQVPTRSEPVETAPAATTPAEPTDATTPAEPAADEPAPDATTPEGETPPAADQGASVLGLFTLRPTSAATAR
ncbi:MAG TPA: outer membrane protein transport protein [Nannocystaceae bacterium]|nr:outer membrane protein transport protein [Nannocystaceae bacterium]